MKYTTEEKYWIWLSSIEGIGPKRFYELLSLFGGDPFNVWTASENDLLNLHFLGNKTIQNVLSCRRDEYIDNLFQNLEKKEIYAICRLNSYYPSMLANIFDPPPVLYVKGDVESLNFPRCISIVGSRRCTRYGREMAERFGKELAEQDVLVVSGMARGIDTCAHLGCLSLKGKTIAVLGCGVDVLYPPENHKLYKQIQDYGAIVSEYLPGTQPLSQHFPARNRIISGLSSGTLVVEAGDKSGSMITVDFALEQGRDVFAIPGNINSQYSIGSNRLLKEGAKIVTDIYDILEEYGWGEPKKEEPDVSKESFQLDIFESMIVQLLEEGDLSYEELLEKTGFTAQKINSVLTMLELRGIIKQLPGKIFSK